MNKINELIISAIQVHGTVNENEQIWTSNFIRKIMKEYAECYAQKVISEIKKPENKIYHPEIGLRSYIIDDDFKLPEHE